MHELKEERDSSILGLVSQGIAIATAECLGSAPAFDKSASYRPYKRRRSRTRVVTACQKVLAGMPVNPHPMWCPLMMPDEIRGHRSLAERGGGCWCWLGQTPSPVTQGPTQLMTSESNGYSGATVGTGERSPRAQSHERGRRQHSPTLRSSVVKPQPDVKLLMVMGNQTPPSTARSIGCC